MAKERLKTEQPSTEITITDAIPVQSASASSIPLSVVPIDELGSNDDRDDPQNVQTASELPAGGLDMGALGTAIGNAVAEGMARNQPKRKVTFGQYDPKTAFQPDKRLTIKLQRECYQNGCWMNPATMFNDEIKLLNAITHSGRYINRLVEVALVPNGGSDDVHLRYSNKTFAQRIEHKNAYRSLTDMLQQIVDAQAIEREEDQANERVRALRSARR